jgi:hypothetical protein
MPETAERLGKVEERLEVVEKRLGSVEQGVGELRREVQGLRVVGEEQVRQTKLVAEVQGHHGKVLDELRQDIRPLKSLRDLMRQIAQDHERRLVALESGGGEAKQPEG